MPMVGESWVRITSGDISTSPVTRRLWLGVYAAVDNEDVTLAVISRGGGRTDSFTYDGEGLLLCFGGHGRDQ